MKRIVLIFDLDDAHEASPTDEDLETFAEELNLEVATTSNLGYQGWRIEEEEQRECEHKWRDYGDPIGVVCRDCGKPVTE